MRTLWVGVPFAYMQSYDLSGFRTDTEERCGVDDLRRLGIGVDLPVLRQRLLDDKCHRLGCHVLKQVLPLRNCDFAALFPALECFLDMLGGVHAREAANGVMVLQVRFRESGECVALIEQYLAALVYVNLLEGSAVG